MCVCNTFFKYFCDVLSTLVSHEARRISGRFGPWLLDNTEEGSATAPFPLPGGPAAEDAPRITRRARGRVRVPTAHPSDPPSSTSNDDAGYAQQGRDRTGGDALSLDTSGAHPPPLWMTTVDTEERLSFVQGPECPHPDMGRL